MKDLNAVDDFYIIMEYYMNASFKY